MLTNYCMFVSYKFMAYYMHTCFLSFDSLVGCRTRHINLSFFCSGLGEVTGKYDSTLAIVNRGLGEQNIKD